MRPKTKANTEQFYKELKAYSENHHNFTTHDIAQELWQCTYEIAYWRIQQIKRLHPNLVPGLMVNSPKRKKPMLKHSKNAERLTLWLGPENKKHGECPRCDFAALVCDECANCRDKGWDQDKNCYNDNADLLWCPNCAYDPDYTKDKQQQIKEAHQKFKERNGKQ